MRWSNRSEGSDRGTPAAPGMWRPLVLQALVFSVLPFSVLGGILVLVLNYNIDVTAAGLERNRSSLLELSAGQDLKTRAILGAHQIDLFIDSRIDQARSWAKDRSVIEAAVKGHETHSAEGIVGLPIDRIEEMFSARKSLGVSPESDLFLKRQLNASSDFAEIFFTDRNGFNVSITNPTSDFVQSDEGWWRGAWSHGVSVSQVGYDDSAEVWSTDISIRLNHPDTGAPLGVMKTVLAIESVQRLADRIAESVPGGRVLVGTPDGRLIAETESQHSSERIMNLEVNLQNPENASVIRDALTSGAQGFTTDGEWSTGYAHTSRRGLYLPSLERFSGLDWVVIVQRPANTGSSVLDIFDDIVDAQRAQRTIFLVILGGVMIASALVVVAFGWFSARRLGSSLRAMRDVGEHAMQGKDPSFVRVDRPEELIRLSETVHRLSQVCAIVIRRRNRQRQS